MKLHFLHGTETGNAEMVCEDIEADLGGGYDVTISNMGDIDPGKLQADTFYFIVTSTYGNGDFPGAAVAFPDALEAGKPDLSHVRFAIFGLGDMVFAETFNHGSERLMQMMIDCGAHMVGTRALHDASGHEMPEDLALPWARDVLAQLQAAAA